MSKASVEIMSERCVIPPPIPMVKFTKAQLERREELLHEPVRQFKISEHPGAVSLLETMRAGSFQGRQLGEAAVLYERMTYEELGIIWSLAGSLFSAGMRQVVIDGIRNGLVDILVCTGALFEQDMLEALGHHHYHCQPTQDKMTQNCKNCSSTEYMITYSTSWHCGRLTTPTAQSPTV